MEKQKKPQIRLKKYTKEWEQHKLEELGIATSGTSIESEFKEGEKYKVISIGSYSENSTYNDQGIRARSSEKTKKRILNKNDLTMILNDKTSIGRIIGRVLIIDEEDMYIYNQRTQRIEPYHDKYDATFLYEMLNAPQIRKKIYQKSQGNTQIYVNWSTIKELEYMIPELKEQKEIGQMFKKINNLIELHESQYKKITNLKTTLIRKMFPEKDKEIPEIRFKGYTQKWEKRKIEEIFEYERPDKYIVKSEEYSNNSKTPVLTANKTFILGYTDETNTYTKEKESILFDDFTLDTKYVDFPYMVKSSALKILTLKNKETDDLKFNYELLKNTKFNILGHARHYISVVQPKEIYTTKKEEQEKITEIIKKIDKLITLQENQISKLKEVKKTLQNKIFI